MRLPWAIASCLGATLLAGCADPPVRPLRIGLSVWPPYEMAFLARELSYFEGARFELVDMRSPDSVMRAYRNGLLDAVAVTAEYVIEVAAFEGDDRIVLAIDLSVGGDALLARPDIPDLASLRGKRIGSGGQALGLHILARALETGGLAKDEVEIVALDRGLQRAAFESGEIDALVTYEPTRTQLLRSGARELFSSQQMPGEIVDVLMMRESVVKAREREVRAFGDGWFRAVDAFRADPAGMARLMAAREEMTPAEVVAAFERVVLLDRAANRRLLGGSAPALVPALDDLARTMVDFRLIDTAPDVASLVTDTLVRGP